MLPSHSLDARIGDFEKNYVKQQSPSSSNEEKENEIAGRFFFIIFPLLRKPNWKKSSCYVEKIQLKGHQKALTKKTSRKYCFFRKFLIFFTNSRLDARLRRRQTGDKQHRRRSMNWKKTCQVCVSCCLYVVGMAVRSTIEWNRKNRKMRSFAILVTLWRIAKCFFMF